MKRILSMLLAVVMVISMFPVVAFATVGFKIDEFAGWDVPNAVSSGIYTTYDAPGAGTVTINSNYDGVCVEVGDQYAQEVSVTVEEACTLEVVFLCDDEIAVGDWIKFTPTVTFEAAAVPGDSAENPLDLTSDLLYEGDFTATVTVPADKTYHYIAYRVGGMVMTINDGEGVACTTQGMMMPYSWTITNDGDAPAQYVIKIGFPVGSMENPAVLSTEDTNVATIAAGGQPYYFTWTAPAEGTLVIDMPQYIGWSYTIDNLTSYTYGDRVTTSDDYVEDPAYVSVAAGDELMITVTTYDANNPYSAPAGTLKIEASFEATPGTQANPYALADELVWNDAQTEATAELWLWEGETAYYSVPYSGMELYINDEFQGVVAGSRWMPQVIGITGVSDMDPVVVKLVAPSGTMDNPEVIEDMSWFNGQISQAEGDSDGYFYSYTAPADGVVTLYFNANYSDEGDLVEFTGIRDIAVTNMFTYRQLTLMADGVDNYGLELQVPVAEGDELLINVIVVEDANGAWYPAAEISWTGNFAYPAGSSENPISIEWAWDEAYTTASAEVTVAAGETVYYSGFGDMILFVDDEVVEMDEMGVFSITNSGDADKEYVLSLETPVGQMGNPEVIEEIPYEHEMSLEEDGAYCYIWTATADTKLVLNVTEGANITADVLTYVEDSEWPISEQYELAEPEIDENWNYTGWIVKENLTLDVKAGQQVKIQVNGLTDWENWTVPAIDYVLTVESPAGTEQNPVMLYDQWNFVANEGTMWYSGRFNGMVMSVSGEGEFSVIYNGQTYAAEDGLVEMTVSSGNPRMPVSFAIVGDGFFDVNFEYPMGSQDNPAPIALGNNAAEIEAGSQGYFFTYIAEFAGELKVTVSNDDGGWVYAVHNLTSYAYGDTQWSDSDPVVNPTVIDVTEGDEIMIMVNTYDPADPWSAPAGTVNVKLEGPSVAVVNGDGYLTLEAAMEAAESIGEATVTLVDEVDAWNIMVAPGITLDLNGYELRANYVVVFNGGNIIDSSEANTGKLAAGADSVSIGKGNAQLPVWTGDGYIFVTVPNFMEMTDDQGVYWFLPYFEAITHQYLAQGADSSRVKVAIRMNWTISTGTAFQNFVYNDSTVAEVVNSFANGNYGYAFNATVTDSKYEGFAMQVILISDTGVELALN